MEELLKHYLQRKVKKNTLRFAKLHVLLTYQNPISDFTIKDVLLCHRLHHRLTNSSFLLDQHDNQSHI